VKFFVLANSCLLLLLSACLSEKDGIIMTVNGPVSAGEMGLSLIHEHILVDFIGADSITEKRWDKARVIQRSLPFLRQVRHLGCRTFVECTPAFLGRDPILLKSLSDSTQLHILTNTGYYGAADNKYLPKHAFTETAGQLAARWIQEWEAGINNTGIKPGFIKIGVAGDSLSGLHRKLVTAAAETHLSTGLTIASHTGPALPAFQQLDILKSMGVAPEAFIWVHAQEEKDLSFHVRAARMGAWISLDGLSGDNIDEYVKMIDNLRKNGLTGKILLSHDAGWYHPGEANGGDFRDYSALFTNLVPVLKNENFSEEEINQLLISNPAKAFKIEVHRSSDRIVHFR